MLSLTTLSAIAFSLLSTANAISFHPQFDQLSNYYDTPNRFLSNVGPFNEAIGFGLKTDAPETCTVDQAHIVMREVERFPSKYMLEDFQEFLITLQNRSIATATGPLSFVYDYPAFDVNSVKYGTHISFGGNYAGTAEIAKLAAQLRARYNHLLNDSSTTPLFAAGTQSLYDTAHSFAQSFFFGGAAGAYEVYIFDESVTDTANTVTAAYSCPAYDDGANDAFLDGISYDFGIVEADRINELSPGFNLTDDNVWMMKYYCAYELNSVGQSSLCGALSTDFMIKSEYTDDLSYYYSYGPGYNMSSVAGGLYVNATATMMKQGPEVAGPISFTFTDSLNLLNYITALGFFDDETALPLDTVKFNRKFHVSQLISQGSRVITERLACTNSTSGGDDEYVRILINNQVYPISSCNSGPGFSCPLDEYYDLVQSKTVDYASACNLTESASQYLSFYWDWQTANYTTYLP